MNAALKIELKLYEVPLRICGTWPLEKCLFRDVKFIFAVTAQLLIIPMSLMKTVDGCVENETLIDRIYISTCSSFAFVKTTNFWLYSDRISENLRSVSVIRNDFPYDDWIQNANDFKMARKLFLFQTVISNIPSNIFLINSLLNIQNNNCTGWTNFSINFAKCIQLTFITIGNIGHDLFYIFLVLHICGQLHILEYKYSKLAMDSNEKQCKRKLSKLIDEQQRLLTLFKNLDVSFSKLLMIQFMLSLVAIYVIDTQSLATLSKKPAGLTLNQTSFASVVLYQLFVYSLANHYLESNLKRITNAVYFSEWYTMPPKILKDVIFILMRTNHPTKIIVNPFYGTDLINFAVLKMFTSWSFVANNI